MVGKRFKGEPMQIVANADGSGWLSSKGGEVPSGQMPSGALSWRGNTFSCEGEVESANGGEKFKLSGVATRTSTGEELITCRVRTSDANGIFIARFKGARQ